MKNNKKNYYQLLGIKKTASIGEIKVAYRRLIAVQHPDKGNNEQNNEVWLLNLAYHTLKDPKRRADYDRRLLAESLTAGTPFEKIVANFDNVQFDRQAFEQAVERVASEFADNLTHNAKRLRQKISKPFIKKSDTIAPTVVQVMAWQAVLGDEIIIKINGLTLKLKLPPNTQNGTLFKIHNSESPILIKIELIIPTATTDEQHQAWQNLKKSYQNQ